MISATRRIAGLGLDLDTKARSVAHLAGLIARIQAVSSDPVEGEKELQVELAGILETCRSHLGTLSGETRGAGRLAVLGAMEEALDDVAWDVLPEVCRNLDERIKGSEKKLSELGAAVNGWRPHIDQLDEVLFGARSEGVPLLSDERRRTRLRDLVNQFDRAQQDREFLKLPDIVGALAAEKVQGPEAMAAIEETLRARRPYARQADLLILRLPPNEKLRVIEYTVLLRTASLPGSHGVNMQGASTITDKDRQRMEGLLQQVTAAFDDDVRHGHPGRAGPGADLGTDPGRAPAAGAARHIGAFPARDGMETDPNGLLRDLGEFLFRIFLPEQIQRYLETTICSLTITTNDLELPWELMVIDGQHLCLTRPVARLPMGFDVPRQLSAASAKGSRSKRILLVHSDPGRTLHAAGAEVTKIRDALQETWAGEIELEVIAPDQCTGDLFNEVLRKDRYDMIHYAGHASFDRRRPHLSSLLLHEHESLFAEKIRRWLRGQPLVFLNACQSAATSNPGSVLTTAYELSAASEGLAAAFVYGGALGCIGSIWPVFDAAAADFSIAFYNRVLHGETIGEALRSAREHVRKAYPEQITWASFSLYGDPTFRLFN